MLYGLPCWQKLTLPTRFAESGEAWYRAHHFGLLLVCDCWLRCVPTSLPFSCCLGFIHSSSTSAIMFTLQRNHYMVPKPVTMPGISVNISVLMCGLVCCSFATNYQDSYKRRARDLSRSSFVDSLQMVRHWLGCLLLPAH